MDQLGCDFSGWQLLQHLLHLLPDLKEGKNCIHEAECSCTVMFHSSMRIFDIDVAPSTDGKDVKGSLLWYIKEKILLPFKNCPADAALELGAAADATASNLALSVLASVALHDIVNRLPARQIGFCKSSSNEGLGLRAAVQMDDNFIGREEELEIVRKAAISAFDGSSPYARRVVLLQGKPGLGKSLAAAQGLRHAQNDYSEQECSQCFYSEIVRGRGVSVKDDLVALGRILGAEIGVPSVSPPDVVLAALKKFLSNSRYVILIDDADAAGLQCALKYLPISRQCSTLIITTQFLSCDDVSQQLSAACDITHVSFLHKQMQAFTPDECTRLMRQVCPEFMHDCMYFSELQEQILHILGHDDDGLGHLPLAVRLFAHWSKEQYMRNMRPYESDMKKSKDAFCKAAKEEAELSKVTFIKDDVVAAFKKHYESEHHHSETAIRSLLAQWRSEMDKVIFQANSTYSRGLLGTVRLALFHMEALDLNLKESCMQLLGLLALCPPVNVPWSLFDGGAEGEAELLVRGKRVEIFGLNTKTLDGRLGRVLQLHTAEVDVIFGCETGACRMHVMPKFTFYS